MKNLLRILITILAIIGGCFYLLIIGLCIVRNEVDKFFDKFRDKYTYVKYEDYEKRQ